MKKILPIFILSILILSACSTTSVYPGQKEDRDYHSQSVRACEIIEIECEEEMQVFSDDTGCGCEIPVGDPIGGQVGDQIEEPVDEPVDEPVVDIECGISGEVQVNCEEGMCAVLEGEDEATCVSDNFCDDYCEEGFECVIMESYPVQIRCNEVVEEEVVEEEVVEEEAVETTNEEASSDTKTYTWSADYGITFEYPSDLYVIDQGGRVLINDFDGLPDGGTMAFIPRVIVSDKTLEEQLNESQYDEMKELTQEQIDEMKEYTDFDSITEELVEINGNVFTKVVYFGLYGGRIFTDYLIETDKGLVIYEVGSPTRTDPAEIVLNSLSF